MVIAPHEQVTALPFSTSGQSMPVAGTYSTCVSLCANSRQFAVFARASTDRNKGLNYFSDYKVKEKK